MPVVAFGTLDDPLASDHVLRRFSLAAPLEFEMMAFKQLFIPMEGFAIELTNDLIDPDLVDVVDPAFQQHKNKQYHQDENGRKDGGEQVAGTDGHTQTSRYPDHRGGRDPANFAAGTISLEYDTGADEADPCSDVGGDTVRIAGSANDHGENGEDRRAQADERQCPETGGFAPVFPLCADRAADEHGQ